MARAGRKRRPDARRRATTRAARSPRDHGTPELLAHRARLVGRASADDPRAGEPLGVLAMAGILSAAQVDAGWRYAVMRWRLFGSPMPATRLYLRYLSGIVGPVAATAVLSHRAERRLRAAYESADGVLRDVGAAAWREARCIAVEQKLPEWFWRARLGQPVIGDDAAQRALQAGLSALAAHFRAGRSGDARSGAVQRGTAAGRPDCS